MRTPLAVIGGAASSLAADDSRIDAATRRELAQSIVEQAAQMTQLVANVLDMTRLESGAGVAKPEWVSLEEIVGSALPRLRRPLAAHEVNTRLEEADADSRGSCPAGAAALQPLENAAKYTPSGSHIRISARRAVDEIELLVADDGPCFAPERAQARCSRNSSAAAPKVQSAASA
jgi:two-component system sensor histidine kinase KdpD